ncbi:hypothetical protein SBOR_7980 [Sclerotinia borealis F-4128]|uniref:Tyrosinase copper-binding domain-containing protein n=1 Tax=Sclerotinia borealis (strain F-4128) TaxID=1432307 RepID=W9C785_SCLBF|nr:hypothetical protein SBOR_7980 [Sclerotinia borealis F-4128]
MVFFRRASIVFVTIAGVVLSRTAQAIPKPQDQRPRGYDYGVDIGALLKRDVTHISTTGVPYTGSSASIPVRQEIRDLEKDADLWELYILGVSMMQTINQSDIRSWYQISGIHGRPYLPYDGVQATPGDENNGYCTHVSILFPTWHRPYLALYEVVSPLRDDERDCIDSLQQVLHSVISFIAEQYPIGAERERYTAAAGNFRIPYWDWAVVPAAGQSVLPASVTTPTIAVLLSMALPVTFSNKAWITAASPGDFDSIEFLHDQIHGLTGSGGHMSYVDYSAFDPLFFLHHSMIDRCFAIWQTLNPESYATAKEASYSTFTMTAGSIQDVSTPLKPFYDAGGSNFYSSSEVVSTETFGYAYPEILKGGNTTTQAIKAINRLYGITAPAKTVSRRTNPELSSRITKKYALAKSFFVHVFLGPFKDDPSIWTFEPNLIGTHCVFAKLSTFGSAAADPNQLVTGTIPLTSALLDDISQGLLSSLNHEDVEPYLKKNLKYRITLLDDTEIENSAVPSLIITVVSAVVQKSTVDHELPKWGPMISHMELSTGASNSTKI